MLPFVGGPNIFTSARRKSGQQSTNPDHVILKDGGNTILTVAQSVAIEAAQAAGKVAKILFDEGFALEEKDEFGDLLTEADLKAEKEILFRLNRSFPDHQIRSEESGWSGVEG